MLDPSQINAQSTGVFYELALPRSESYHLKMTQDFEPLKARLRIICDRLDPDEQAYFGALIERFSGSTSEFQRIMRDLGKFGPKISDGSKFEVYREVQHLFEQPRHKK